MLHLIHPALVHFSVALITVGGVCEAWSVLTGRESLGRWASPVLLLGLGSLVPTLVTGYLAANTLVVPDAARALLNAHERNGWLVFGLLLGSQFWKAWSGGRLIGLQEKLYALLLVGVILFMLYSAWIGGRMVYGHGVGVTDRAASEAYEPERWKIALNA